MENFDENLKSGNSFRGEVPWTPTRRFASGSQHEAGNFSLTRILAKVNPALAEIYF